MAGVTVKSLVAPLSSLPRNSDLVLFDAKTEFCVTMLRDCIRWKMVSCARLLRMRIHAPRRSRSPRNDPERHRPPMSNSVVLSVTSIRYPAHRPFGTGVHQEGPLLVRHDRTDRRVSTSVDRSTSVNRIVLYVVGILWRPAGRRWRLRTVLLRCVRRATPKRRDAMGASPIRRFRRIHVGSHAGHTAAASTAGSRPRRTLAAVQGRA